MKQITWNSESMCQFFVVFSVHNRMASGGSEADGSDGGKRNLVVDEAAFEEQFLRCHICRDKFDQEDKAPKSLPCNHTFCQTCLKQVGSIIT